jgi:hypothetical protein
MLTEKENRAVGLINELIMLVDEIATERNLEDYYWRDFYRSATGMRDEIMSLKKIKSLIEKESSDTEFLKRLRNCW